MRRKNEERTRNIYFARGSMPCCIGIEPTVSRRDQSAEHGSINWSVRCFQYWSWNRHHHRWHRLVGRFGLRVAGSTALHNAGGMAITQHRCSASGNWSCDAAGRISWIPDHKNAYAALYCHAMRASLLSRTCTVYCERRNQGLRHGNGL